MIVTIFFAENAKLEVQKRALEPRYQDLEVEIRHQMSLNQDFDIRTESKIALNKSTNIPSIKGQFQNITVHFNNLKDEIDSQIFNYGKDLKHAMIFSKISKTSKGLQIS
jgi:hypothetical protein